MTQESLLPRDDEAEQQVIGALLKEPLHATTLAALLPPTRFYDQRHQAIAAAVYRLGDAADLVSVEREIQRAKEVDGFEGMPVSVYLIELMLGCHYTSLPQAEHHARRVNEQALRRSLILCGGAISTAAYRAETDSAALPTLAADLLTKATDQAQPAGLTFQQMLADWHAQDEADRASGKQSGIPTKLPDLDALTGGWKPGQLVVVSGQTGFGKTTLMLQFARECALSGKPALIVSLEMTRDEVINKLVSATGKKDVKHMTPDEVSAALNALGKLPIEIAEPSDTQGAAAGISARAYRMKAKRGGLGVVIVDYLGRMNIPESKGQTRAAAIGAVTWSLKELALRLDTTVILGVQINRDGSAQTDTAQKAPELWHLKESSSIEQDADTVLMIHNPKDINPAARTVFVRKNRNGPTGSLDLVGDMAASRFLNAARETVKP